MTIVTGSHTLLPDPEPRPVVVPVISVDDHLIEPPDLFDGRLPATLAGRGPRVREAPVATSTGASRDASTRTSGSTSSSDAPATSGAWSLPGSGLQVALSEGGIGWVPKLMDRVDYALDHSVSGSGRGGWEGELRPNEVLRRNFWFGTIDDPSMVPLLHRIGLDHVMVESGCAHADSTWHDTQAVVGQAFGGQPEPDLRKVAAGNAARRFRHPLPPVDDWRTAPAGP